MENVSPLFIEFIKKCFNGDLHTCELRLSDTEREYVTKMYSSAQFKPLTGVKNTDDKIWYEVTVNK